MPLQYYSQTEALASNHENVLESSSPVSMRYNVMSTNSSNSFRIGQHKFSSGKWRSSTTMPDYAYDNAYRSGASSGYNKSSYNNNRLTAPSYVDSAYHYNSGTSNAMLFRNFSNNGSSSSSVSMDLRRKYSPHNYIPNIQRTGSLNNSFPSDSSPCVTNRSFPSVSTDLFGGDGLNYEGRNCQLQEPVINGSNNKSLSMLLSTDKLLCKTGISDQINSTPKESSSSGRSIDRCRPKSTRGENCGLNGLRNIGNTCFMNSVIQCLSNTRLLLEYLLNEQYLNDINTTTSSMNGALIKAFSQVIQELWGKKGEHVVNTTTLKSQIQRFAPRFMGYSQQDAQEFLRYLLEGLHEDVNRVTIKPQPILSDIPIHYSDSMKATESWKRYLRNEDSMIVDAFVGQLRSSLRCTVCNHISVTLDPFWDLSLPIPTGQSSVKLNQCLEHFTREEILDGDEKPTCSKCQMRRKCTKIFSIQKFPKILVIHLKRFSPMERFRSKLNVLVDFPLTGLELSAFAALRVQGCTYNLYGVANHSGTTHSGHYTAYCKHPYSAEWHEYNDCRVNTISASSVVSSEAYVLFYERQPHNSHL